LRTLEDLNIIKNIAVYCRSHLSHQTWRSVCGCTFNSEQSSMEGAGCVFMSLHNG